MLGTEPDIQQIADRAREFHARLKSAKAGVAPRAFEWYPYDSLANVLHLNQLLTGENRDFPKRRKRADRALIVIQYGNVHRD